MEGEHGDWLSGILLPGGEAPVAGLEELQIPDTQDYSPGSDELQATRNTKGGRRKKNFSTEEDEVVCLAWLAISKDPINGANQTKNTFWQRVHAHYLEHNTSGIHRTESSIMHRFLEIQMCVNKFCAHYASVLRRNQSGTTMQDKVDEAKKVYKNLNKDKKSFVYEHCWNILKGEDKWKDMMVKLAEAEKIAAAKKQGKVAKVSRPRDEGATKNDEVIPLDVEETEPRKRSDGIKKVKANLKRGAGEACKENC